MIDRNGQHKELILQVEKLHAKFELSKNIPENYFEPGMMEFLDQYEGTVNDDTDEVCLKFEVKGTRYDGRTETIESLKVGSNVVVCRDKSNEFNHNNFEIKNMDGESLGNMPAELCNAIAPGYDTGAIKILESKASYIEPISRRSRHAKQAVLFIELRLKLEQ